MHADIRVGRAEPLFINRCKYSLCCPQYIWFASLYRTEAGPGPRHFIRWTELINCNVNVDYHNVYGNLKCTTLQLRMNQRHFECGSYCNLRSLIFVYFPAQWQPFWILVLRFRLHFAEVCANKMACGSIMESSPLGDNISVGT